MDLFKKNVIIISIFLLHTYTIHAKLTKSEERQAMLLKNHLRRLAFRSQYKPLPVSAQTRVEAIFKKLEDFEKKDPEFHVKEQAQAFIKTIKYEAPSIKEEEEKKEKPSAQPSVKESATAELLKKQDVALNEFIEHLLLLQNTQETWKEDKPLDSWKEKALDLLKKPELFDITLENNLNIPSALLDALINRYTYFILLADSHDEKEKAETLKTLKTEYINAMINNIFRVYVAQLYQPGAFWNAETQKIDTVWQHEVLNFLCYALRADFSDQRLKILQEGFNKAITEKYTKENATAKEQLEVAKKEATDFLKKCQDTLMQRSEAIKQPLQQSEANFETLMNIIASARSATPQEKEQHEQQALVQAISWIQKVSSDELNTVVNKIKKMYRDALLKQAIPWYAWAGMYTGNEETFKREKEFNAKLDKMIEEQLQKAPERQPESSQAPGEEKVVIQPIPAPPVEQPQAPEAPQVPLEQVPIAPQVPVEQAPGQPAPEQQVPPVVQPSAPGAEKQPEAQVPQPTEKTEEEKLALLKQYMTKIPSESIERWEVKEGDWEAIIRDEWLLGLLKICSDNGIPLKENVLKPLLEEAIGEGRFSDIKTSYIAQQSFNRLLNLKYEAEQKAASATKTVQINKQLSDYIATLKDTNNWVFAEGQAQVKNEWLAELFKLYTSKKTDITFTKEQLKQVEQLLRAVFTELPAEIKVQNSEDLIKRIIDNINQNIFAYNKAYFEAGSPPGFKYEYQGL